MEILYKDVKATVDEKHAGSVDYKIEIKEKGTIYLRKCQALFDYDIVEIQPHSYQGKYEVNDSKGMTQEKTGTLHIYKDRKDVLLEQ
ncbi:hypothetical protein [Dysgonomonas sp. ZJ709]|uniref:hypothetical protein n=1 Tax=Dysgonomonas sp. ZJ709 TaxID=2709797 RepID=UPI0013E9FB34|nr:hypothetical protein [Dysgonomonas sp. ZJ709]